MLGSSHRTRSLWQGGQIVEQWRSFAGEGQDRETVQIDRWHYELGGQNFKPLAKESLLPQDAKALEKTQDQPTTEQEQPRSQFYPVVSDHLGTPKELYNLKGECVWQAQHELWGRAHIRRAKQYSEHKARTSSTPHSYASDEDFKLPGIDCELRFAGQWEDAESGLHFNFNRYYDPASGQYLSQDPIGLEGGLRTHGYVADPLTWVDPAGLQGCARIAPGSLPAEEEAALMQTLGHIDAGTTPTGPTSNRWGIQFQNKEGHLPGAQGSASPYKEYRVAPPPGTTNAGTRRVVVNSQTGEIYYTWTHYGTAGNPPFVQVR